MNAKLGFSPSRIYVLNDVWQKPLAARRAERICSALHPARVLRFSYDELPDIVTQEGWHTRRLMGEMSQIAAPIPILGLFQFDDAAALATAKKLKTASPDTSTFPFVTAAGGRPFAFTNHSDGNGAVNAKNVCRPAWRLRLGIGCPHRCAYCFRTGFMISHVNTEEYIEHLSQLILHNPWQKTFLYDDAMDVLTLEPVWDTLRPLMEYFQSTRDRYLLVHTKSNRVDPILQSDARQNTIVLWTLTPPRQARTIEPGTASTAQRIEAARACEAAGVRTRHKFKPIVPLRNWQEDASAMIDLLFRRTAPENISLCALIFTPYQILKRAYDGNRLDLDFLQAAEQADADPAFRYSIQAPFPVPMRQRIYEHYLQEIRRWDPQIPVCLSNENSEMWQVMRNVLRVNETNYVCGCGPTALPGISVLPGSPYTAACGALTWKGEAVTFSRREDID